MIGIEGGHQVGGSIASIRQMYDLGARYITLTHNCDNSFGTAATTVDDGGSDGGLFKLGLDSYNLSAAQKGFSCAGLGLPL